MTTSPVRSSDAGDRSTERPRVVIIGSGFGGLFGAKALKRADADVTMIAKTTHHLFQPLLYQVATGILSQGEIAPPTREILADQRNAAVIRSAVGAPSEDGTSSSSPALSRLANTALRAAAGKALGASASPAGCWVAAERICAWVGESGFVMVRSLDRTR